MINTIDLNSDLGESFGQWRMGEDEEILGVISSANIACGFHAGDPVGILQTLKLAQKNDVAIGAHVSYPDLVGFGRRKMEIANHELTADVIYQIGALQGLAAAAGSKVSYVKPHGALYNTIANDEYQGLAVIEGILAIDPNLALVGLAGSNILKLAQEKGLRTIAEAFADRAYTSQGELVSRREIGSVLHDADRVAQRMLQLVTEGGIASIDGKFTPIQADSICVHGDSPGALEMAKRIKAILQQAGITIRPFIHS
ncbi:conserved protein of unknown function [Xenorhabdus poinarii G6]|uniref:5-oxoprolinase subunit A n=1 Tax=Xenorhabdus poinarii G6 TaxID=1354304 RepID=A0A068R666_9GAMM|nr:5-oxoprolinase subunit PxpA [Xenorhabdus poinarii]CDG22698.1 conserved protein of unknown function [Xenorhabdus poinarii G6]